MAKLPIIYVRGYAGTQTEVEDTVDDPFHGFNLGSTHVRVGETGRADFFVFESPFVRLLTDYNYIDVYRGYVQKVDTRCTSPQQTIWIYRYYDPTSKTFDRPGGQRLKIEQAAEGLRDLVREVREQTQANKVVLVAHSMGGLVSRCLLQKIYPQHGERAHDYVDKLFTYGTPHRGIHFEVGGGVLERIRDMFGANNSDDFGARRMYEYLTPSGANGALSPMPHGFRQEVMPASAFDVNRVFCIVGTNSRDYDAAKGMSRALVGPQSDGLVQTDSAWVEGAHRAYIHRSHSGRYGMVNSDEGYQNLRRFLFGDVRVKMVLCDFELDYAAPAGTDVTYQFELQVAIKGIPVLMHERSIPHLCPVTLDESKYNEQKKKGLPLFTNFLMPEPESEGIVTYMLRLGVYLQTYRKGLFLFDENIERLPVWSDYLVVTAKPSPSGDGPYYEGWYNWASASIEPTIRMETQDISDVQLDAVVPLPERGREVLGREAKVRFETMDWF